jgi:alkylhydroperoxidase family enzyme
LFDKLQAGVKEHLMGFTTHRSDGALIGPFNALLHFPGFGGHSFDLFLALADGVLPKEAREVVILSTGGRLGSLYEIYSHETVASKAGLPQSKIRTIASGERPNDLTEADLRRRRSPAPRTSTSRKPLRGGCVRFWRSGRGDPFEQMSTKSALHYPFCF